jgi:hypothetical protein
MRTRRIKIRPDGRLPSGGLPFHPQNRLPLARGDLQSSAEKCQDAFCLDKDEARSEPKYYNSGPPGLRIRLPVRGVDCRGSTLPQKGFRHRERCHDKVGTSVAICQHFSDRFGILCLPPEKRRTSHSGRLAMTMQQGSGPPIGNERARESISPARGDPPWRTLHCQRGDIGSGAWPLVYATGSSPPKSHRSHREQCPDIVGTSVAICQTRSGLGSDCPAFRDPVQRDFVPAETGFAMTICTGCSPPGRNGPVGTSPPNTRNRHPHADLSAEGSDQHGNSQILRSYGSELRMTHGLGLSPPGRNGPVDTSPPMNRNCHPDADLSAEGSDQLRCYQILRSDKSRLRMTGAMWWSPPGRNGPVGTSPPRDVGRNRVNVVNRNNHKRQSHFAGLREEEKFSRGVYLGTPSFSLIANRTEGLRARRLGATHWKWFGSTGCQPVGHDRGGLRKRNNINAFS